MLQKIRVAVVTSDVPFVEGGHLTIARNIVQALRDYGCEADLVLTPQNRFGNQFRAYLATRFTDVEEDGLGRKIHQVISLRFPSYAVKHSLHVCWLNHRLREYYDLWGTLFPQLSWKGKIKEPIRRSFFHLIDSHLLKHNVIKVFAQSKTVQQRLRKWGNIPSSVLYPPPPQRKYFRESYKNYILTVSRLQPLKRIHLLIQAFIQTRNKDIKAVIIGEGPDELKLKQLVRNNQLEKRIIFLGRTDENTLIKHFACCRAVFFAPYQEDYGFVTGEAFSCGKPVITTFDSGGPAELVQDSLTGFITDPDPGKIAEKIDLLAAQQEKAEKMGQNALDYISKITWEKTIEKILLIKGRIKDEN
ncbi:MAG: glycosyltransferase family 4 protein [Acidobacteriota bacterium]